MTDDASKQAKRARNRRERAFVKQHPTIVAISCFVLSIALAGAMRSNGPVGQVARGVAIGIVAIGVVAVACLAVRARLRARKTQERIDSYLSERTRPAIRFQDGR